MKKELFQRWLGLKLLLIFASHLYVYQSVASESEIIEQRQHGWSKTEVDLLRSLWIGSLPPLSPDPSNAVADNPKAAGFGKKLFFDKRFSGNGEISCASCHKPELAFTDGLARAKGIGKTKRGTPSIVGTAYSPWLFWDGRSDSQWSQALGPLEDKKEHGGTRTQYAHIIYSDPDYRKTYEALFGAMPDLSDKKRFPEKAGPVKSKKLRKAWKKMSEQDRELVTRVFVNMGKSIAAYERLIMPAPARFDQYVEALLAKRTALMDKYMTSDELAGLKVFIGKGECVSCHLGPLFTNHAFQNIATEIAPGQATDYGRFKGVQKVVRSEFNCMGKYSDANKDDCIELKFVKKSGMDLMGAFKVPTLRNVTETAPYMHAGQKAALDDVIAHYITAPKSAIGETHLVPLALTEKETAQLKAFLSTLTGPVVH